MIVIPNLKLTPGADEAALKALAAKALKIPAGDITDLRIRKKSLDARKKDDIHYVYTVGVTVHGDEQRLVRRCRSAAIAHEKTYPIPHVAPPETRPVIVGFGPAGMFAALLLARAGARPIVLERGPDARTRSAQIAAFRAGGAFDSECNVQFGEGGAGTFSDGKLNTGTHDARIGFVLAEFAAHGAPEHITYDAKPHIGTDVLVEVVQSLRREVIARGGEVRFGHRVTGLSTEDGHIAALTVARPAGGYTLPARQVILAIGHSARDTFAMLRDAGIPMEPKPFAVGVRIEHRQSDMDAQQYKQYAGHPSLPPTSYKLSAHTAAGRGVFSFCVCPGGQVVAAASEAGRVVTNGMSELARDGENINGGLLVSVTPEDFGGTDVLAGVAFQRRLEEAAYALGGGGYAAPAQTVGDFLAHRPSIGPGRVTPTYRPAVRWCDLHDCLPPFVCAALEEALPLLEKKLHGFAAPDAVLTAVETRSSSPVRIVRDNTYQTALRGLYPCGEGAGYAGGILSAAADGMRCAEQIIKEITQHG